jgi:hypothetical protein
MKNRNQKQTDDEIEADILRKIDDASGWEELPAVGPSKSPRPEWALRAKHLQLAAKFHVLSVLHFHGAEANLALAQQENVDVIAFNRSGVVLTIDVKTLSESGKWVVDPFTVRKHHFVVFVDFTNRAPGAEVIPEVYVVASDRLHDFVAHTSLKRLGMDELNQALDIRNAWQAVLSDAAA